MKKRILTILACVLVAINLFAFSACTNIEGTFYSLEEAYKMGLLAKDDLIRIAYYHNNSIYNPQELNDDTKTAIKEAAAYKFRTREEHPFIGANADGFTIEAFYGIYSGCYVIILSNNYEIFPTDVPNYSVDIDDVQFHYTNYFTIEVWLK